MNIKDKDNLIEDWIKALRSGKYKQGTGYLCKNDKYCCLGVLCEIAKQKGIDISREKIEIGLGHYCYAYDNNRDWLPPILAKAIFNGSSDETDKLSILNDHHEQTFPQIAEYIEKAFKLKLLPYQKEK